MKIHDQLNRIIHIDATPKRIISLVPSQTELLCDLGLEEHIVGVTKFCIHPKHLKNKITVVGGTKQIDISKIIELQPDIILCNKEENSKEIVEACEAICNVHVSDIFNISDSLKMITQYGAIFNKEKEALIITQNIEQEASAFNDFVQNMESKKVAYFLWKTPWMVAANNTFINYLLKLNNFINAYEEQYRYPEISLNALKPDRSVDLVLLSSEPYPFKPKHQKEIQVYYPNAKVLLVDGEFFSWYGSRLLNAFKYFESLHLNLQNNQPD